MLQPTQYFLPYMCPVFLHLPSHICSSKITIYFLNFQLYGYNAHLFTNLSEAVLHPHGAVGVTIMVQESERAGNKVLRHITSNLNKVIFIEWAIFGTLRYFSFNKQYTDNLFKKAILFFPNKFLKYQNDLAYHSKPILPCSVDGTRMTRKLCKLFVNCCLCLFNKPSVFRAT